MLVYKYCMWIVVFKNSLKRIRKYELIEILALDKIHRICKTNVD